MTVWALKVGKFSGLVHGHPNMLTTPAELCEMSVLCAS